MRLQRALIFPEAELPDAAEILSTGRRQAPDWPVVQGSFLRQHQCACEADYKRHQMRHGRVMQHAHMGFRDQDKSIRAFAQIYEETAKHGVTVDRIGVCLDWSMGFPRAIRNQQLRGTGLLLNETDDFVKLTEAAPLAPHFGDFVLGFPAALENTQSALAAGATVIGNLGQYFTFRLPNWHDDIAITESTLTALALMAAQPVDVLAHSNLDDGFAAVFTDLASAIGAALVERYIVEELIGGKITHCFGHHYTTPATRLAFYYALHQVSPAPGSMIYGNTVSYTGGAAQNYASLSAYLLVDLIGQTDQPSGHAVNPVPVTENQRIPDIDEIIQAQLFAARLADSRQPYTDLIDRSESQRIAARLLAGGEIFKRNLLTDFARAGIDTGNPFEMLLAIRRIGGETLEQWYAPGRLEQQRNRRTAWVLSDTVRHIDALVEQQVAHLQAYGAADIAGSGLKIITATTDVHKHSKMMLEQIFHRLGIQPIDGGVSVDPDELARRAERCAADAIALTTYNGVALTYFCQLRDVLQEIGLTIPVLIGGQLNQIAEDNTASLPQNVIPELRSNGAIVCEQVHDIMPTLLTLAAERPLSNIPNP